MIAVKMKSCEQQLFGFEEHVSDLPPQTECNSARMPYSANTKQFSVTNLLRLEQKRQTQTETDLGKWL